LYIGAEIENRFLISGGKPGLKVSWQVTCIRHDAFAEANRIPVEEPKQMQERGYFLHPELFGQSQQRSIFWASRPEPLKRMLTIETPTASVGGKTVTQDQKQIASCGPAATIEGKVLPGLGRWARFN
jgi:hypothetical protein